MGKIVCLGIDHGQHVIYSVSEVKKINALKSPLSPKCSFLFYKFNAFSNFTYTVQEFRFPYVDFRAPFQRRPEHEFVFVKDTSSVLIAPKLYTFSNLPSDKLINVSLLNIDSGKFEIFSADYNLSVQVDEDCPKSQFPFVYKTARIFYLPDRGWSMLVCSKNKCFLFDVIFLRDRKLLSIKFEVQKKIFFGRRAIDYLSSFEYIDFGRHFGHKILAYCGKVEETLQTKIFNLNNGMLERIVVFEEEIFPEFPSHVRSKQVSYFTTAEGELFAAFVTPWKNCDDFTMFTEAVIFKINISTNSIHSFQFVERVRLESKVEELVRSAIFKVFDCSLYRAFTFCSRGGICKILIKWNNTLHSPALRSIFLSMPSDLSEIDQGESLHLSPFLIREYFGPQWTILMADEKRKRRNWYRKCL